MDVYLEAFLPLFVAINLPGILPLFIGMTQGLPEHTRRKLVLQALTTALVVALCILFTGQIIFTTLGITVNDLRIGGGLILLILSITDLLFGDLKRRAPGEEEEHHDTDIGIVPIGIPLVIGPAAITTIIVSQQEFGYPPAFVSMVVNFGLVLIAFFYGPALLNRFGDNLTKAVAKVASLFLAAISVAMIRTGIAGIVGAF